MQLQTRLKRKFLAAMVLPLCFMGCTTTTKDAGYQEVVGHVKARNEQVPQKLTSSSPSADINRLTQEILSHPLSANEAVRVALLNNADLQALLAELDIAQADLVQAGRMRNPTLSYLKLNAVTDEYDIERTILFDVMSLLTIPLRTSIEKQHFEQAKLQAAEDILAFAAKTRKAYYQLIAAEQTLHFVDKVTDAAEAGFELAQEMHKVGNVSQLQKAREQAFYKEMVAKRTSAKISAIQAREQLYRLMGVAGASARISLPNQLPSLPSHLRKNADLEKTALKNRLDIQLRRQELAGKAKALGLTKTTRFINVLDVGYARNSSHSVSHQTGYEINLEIPLFDWGGAKVAKAENIYLQSAWRLRDTILKACSQAREAYQIYQMTYEIARNFQDEIVPLRKKILQEELLRYNGMLLSPFELLAGKREQMNSVIAGIEAHRDFLIAETNLQVALMVSSPEH